MPPNTERVQRKTGMMAVDSRDARQANSAWWAHCLDDDGRRPEIVACDDVHHDSINPAVRAAAQPVPSDGRGRRVTGALPPCLADPDRWVEGGDDPALKALCRSCPRRWPCAKESLDTGGIEGMVAGVHVAKAGRARSFALRQLQSLAAHAGYTSQPIFR